MTRGVRIVLVAALAAFSLTLAPQLAGAADAAGCVRIHRIYYNSPGADTGSNTSLNAEWIVLRSTCARDRNLTGWTIRDVANHEYTFGTYTLAAGAKVKIHTGSGTDTTRHRYWGSDGYIWNNRGDTAYLYNAAGTLKRSCSYPGGSPGYVYC